MFCIISFLGNLSFVIIFDKHKKRMKCSNLIKMFPCRLPPPSMAPGPQLFCHIGSLLSSTTRVGSVVSAGSTISSPHSQLTARVFTGLSIISSDHHHVFLYSRYLCSPHFQLFYCIHHIYSISKKKIVQMIKKKYDTHRY